MLKSLFRVHICLQRKTCLFRKMLVMAFYGRELLICTMDGYWNGKISNVACSPWRLPGLLHVVEGGGWGVLISNLKHAHMNKTGIPTVLKSSIVQIESSLYLCDPLAQNPFQIYQNSYLFSSISSHTYNGSEERHGRGKRENHMLVVIKFILHIILPLQNHGQTIHSKTPIPSVTTLHCDYMVTGQWRCSHGC